jgi:ribosomal protein S18 acetylase RimI-like enzyme
MQTRIRQATAADCEAIAAVHVVGWRESYRGLMPDSVLDALSIAERAALWRRSVSQGTSSVLVAEVGTALVGFAAGGPRRGDAFAHDGFACDGELYAIYVLRTAQGAGVGSRLLRETAAALARREFTALALWVLRANFNARQFYHRHGGRIVAERIEDVRGHQLAEIAYGWADLAGLAKDAAAAVS